MKRRMIQCLRPGVAATLCLLLLGCASAKVTREADIGPVPVSRPAVIYVANFDLDVGEIKSEGIISSFGSGPLLGSMPHPLGLLASDEETTAHELVDTMANSLVQDLREQGFTAQRLAPESAPPVDGWLLRGIFTQVDEGNRMRRAIIGFGAGQTDMEVATKLDDLSLGPPEPFYEVDTAAESGKMPGAVVTMSPAAAAVKFVIAAGDLKRNAEQTAGEIAKSVAARVPK